MAVNTKELKARISIENKATKDLEKIKRDFRGLKKESNEVDKVLKRKKNIRINTSKANQDLKRVGSNAKKIDNELKKTKSIKVRDEASNKITRVSSKMKELSGKGKISIQLKDMASSSLNMINGKIGGMGKLGKIALKLIGKNPALACLAVVGLAVGKLAKAAYNDVKLRIKDMTQWTLQKVRQGLDAIKDKVINVSIQGYNKYSDYKSRTNFIQKKLGFNDYDSLAFSVAKNTKTSVVDTRDNLTKLIQMSPKTFGNNTKEAAKFYQAAIQSFRVGGSSNEEASNAMYQLNQGLASGVLQGDELRTIRESAPLMAKMIEKELGKNIKEAGSKGLITADVVKRALLKNADEINKKFKSIPMNFADMWVIASNSIHLSAIKPMYERMQQFMKSDAFISFFEGVSSKVEKLFDGIWKLLDFTNFGGIDFSILENSFKPISDFLEDIYTNIVNNSPEAQEAINVLGQVVNGTFEGMGDVFNVFKDIAKDVFQFLKENPNFIRNAITLLASDWKKSWVEMKLKIDFAEKYIIPFLTNVNNFINSISDAIQNLKKWWGDALNYMSSHGFNVGGHGPQGLAADSQGSRDGVKRRAMGQARIPYDNFYASLHEGERVLTKREANDYDKRNSSNGVVINMHGTIFREEADIDLFTDRLVRKLRLELEGGV